MAKNMLNFVVALRRGTWAVLSHPPRSSSVEKGKFAQTTQTLTKGRKGGYWDWGRERCSCTLISWRRAFSEVSSSSCPAAPALEERVKSGDSSTSSWIVFCTNSSNDAICVWTRDYNNKPKSQRTVDILIKVCVNDAPAIFLADDAFLVFDAVEEHALISIPVGGHFRLGWWWRWRRRSGSRFSQEENCAQPRRVGGQRKETKTENDRNDYEISARKLTNTAMG